jgi:multiple sugar transport system ATP-binding protein
MKDGKVEQVGSPMEVYQNPKNKFVAGFIGSPPMNFLQSSVTSGAAHFPDGSLLELPPLRGPIPDGPIHIGIRPKHMMVGRSGEPGTYPFAVSLVEPTGDEMELTGQLLGHTVTVVVTTMQVMPGDTLSLAVPQQSLFMFDAESGARL